MKVYIYLLVFLLQQMHSHADCSWFSGLQLGPECITLTQLYNATETLCAQKDNLALWKKVIECHHPITELFMRNSGEGRCFYPDYGVDALNYGYSLEKIFYNICGLVEAPWYDLPGIGACIVGGWYFMDGSKSIDSHRTEVNDVKANWGDDVPCNIGKCILDLGLGVGA